MRVANALRTKQDDNFKIIAKPATEEHTQVQAGMQEIEDRITEDMNPLNAAKQMDVDEIHYLHERRANLEIAIEATYQSTGHRRIKPPQIWSLHDIATLAP